MWKPLREPHRVAPRLCTMYDASSQHSVQMCRAAEPTFSISWTSKISCIQCCGAGQVTKVDPPQPQTSRPQGVTAPTKPEVQGATGSLVATSNVRMHAPCLAGLEGSIRCCFAANSGMWMPLKMSLDALTWQP